MPRSSHDDAFYTACSIPSSLLLLAPPLILYTGENDAISGAPRSYLTRE